MPSRSRSLSFLALAAIFAALGGLGFAGTASSVTGLYYTGVNGSGGTLSGGAQDTHWSVVYSDVANTLYSGNSTYSGAPYVVSNSYIDSGWTPNTSTARWIVPPGAKNSSGTTNVGGDLLPGNGTTGNNDATFVYQLAFNVAGTGTGAVANKVSISLTIAADDQYTIYVNPTYDASGITSAASASRTNAWNNTQAEYLQNYTDPNASANSNFVIGTNYIWVVVNNTNSVTGSSTATSLNASGLLVYQVGSAVVIGGPIPETGTMLPVLGALGLFGWRWLRRRVAEAAV